MRWIFVTLIVINLGYLAWQLYDRTRAQPARVKSYQRNQSDSLRMLSEGTEKSLQEFQAPDLQTVATDPMLAPMTEEASAADCMTIGPFPDIFTGRQLINQLASMKIEAEVRAIDKEIGAYDYRVLIPPLNSLQESFRKLRELKARNIDSYVLTSGEYALGISLGVFSSKSLALQTRENMEENGYAVSLAEIPRLHREYWLFPVEGTELSVNEIWWQNLLEKYDSVEKRRLRCE